VTSPFITVSPPGPCGWSINPGVCNTLWDTYDPGVQDAAIAFAQQVLWSATGRRFTSCEVTVRPCIRENFGGWGLFYEDGTWLPYIAIGGQWVNGWNCGCFGGCGLHPFTEVKLPGVVSGIVNVTIDGTVLTPTAYRVDDAQWLVRQDGQTWPVLANYNLMNGMTGTWSVTFIKGTPPPTALLNAAGTLASEYAKACVGAACRLPGYVTQIIRTGVTVSMIDQADLLKSGFTGIVEVDQIIRALNPHGLAGRPRLYSPDVRPGRIQTTP
jgi:hypothetical protein